MFNGITGQFLKRPLTTGAICASSKGLARMMVSGIGIDTADVIVELGPGTGAITGTILNSIQPAAHFFAVELNTDIIGEFRKKFPGTTVYNDSAAHLPDLLRKEGVDHADIVLSGLPWAAFPPHLQDEILSGVTAAMPKGSVFVTFAYLQGTLLPTGLAFRKRLGKYFSEVKKSKIVWKNLPPAFVYRCKL